MAPSLTLSLVEWLGVAVFVLSGVMVAARTHMDPFGFALLATVTGVGGGTLGDLLLGVKPVFWVADPTEVLICVSVAIVMFAVGPGEPSLVLRKEIYITAAAVGAAVYVQLQFLGFPPGGAAAIGATVALILRGLAILRGWSLPNFSS